MANTLSLHDALPIWISEFSDFVNLFYRVGSPADDEHPVSPDFFV
jgi:hypothetical protein